jgi:hypothetical protein
MPEAKGRHDREVSTGFPAHEFCSQWSIQDRKQTGLFEERESEEKKAGVKSTVSVSTKKRSVLWDHEDT